MNKYLIFRHSGYTVVEHDDDLVFCKTAREAALYVFLHSSGSTHYRHQFAALKTLVPGTEIELGGIYNGDCTGKRFCDWKIRSITQSYQQFFFVEKAGKTSDLFMDERQVYLFIACGFDKNTALWSLFNDM